MICILHRRESDKEVDQFGFVDIENAFTTGMVAPSSNTDEMSFDGDIDDTDKVGRLVKNRFDAMDNLQNVMPPK